MLSTFLQDLLHRWEEDDGILPSLEEQQALQDFLDRKTKPEEAAAAYTSVVENSSLKSPDATDLYTLITIVAQEFPETQDLLIDLLKAIKSLPPLARDGQDVVNRYGERYWSDLPGLYFDLKEYYDGSIHSIMHNSDAQGHTWFINLSSFIAKLTHSKLLSFENSAVQTIAEALEVDHTNDDRLLNVLISAAAQFTLQAGRELFESDKENLGARVYIDSGKHEITGPLLRKARQTSPIGRWEFWKERFVVTSSRDGLENGMRDMARQALSAMSAVEGR